MTKKKGTLKEYNFSEGVMIKDIIFAVLFAVGKVSLHDLCEKLNITTSEAWFHIKELEKSLKETPFVLLYADDNFRLATRPEYSPYISKFRSVKQNLSSEALETLAIIIYKQPCTKAEIEEIRGVDCEKTISTLIRAGLIRAIGNIKKPGSPVMYTITDNCLFALGVKSYQELLNIVKAKKDEI